LRAIAADPEHLGAELGFFAVLHTWGQTLLHHPHLHCVVAGGGLSPDGSRWVACRRNFFLPVCVFARLFRRLFLASLEKAFDATKLTFYGSLEPLRDRRAFQRYLAPARKAEWYVYAKPPFAGPEQVLAYVARYTHRVAISNNRLVGIDQGKVRFRWKDYRNGSGQKTMSLAAFAASCCTFYPKAFNASATTASWPTATASTSWRGVINFLPCRNPRRRMRPPFGIIVINIGSSPVLV